MDALTKKIRNCCPQELVDWINTIQSANRWVTRVGILPVIFSIIPVNIQTSVLDGKVAISSSDINVPIVVGSVVVFLVLKYVQGRLYRQLYKLQVKNKIKTPELTSAVS